jgi:aspartyl-tRNA(Asn)/glutamyl-tRNA(Gln) amidotransferase subunit A
MSDTLSKAATAGEIAHAVMSGKAKASAVVDAALKRIAAAEPTVNAFTDIVAERAASARPRSMPAATSVR